MTKNINNILEFISSWGDSEFSSSLLQEVLDVNKPRDEESEEQDDDTGEVIKVKTDEEPGEEPGEEPEEKSSRRTRIFGGIAKLTGGVARVAGGLGVARDLASGVTGPIHHGRETDILKAIGTAAGKVERATIIRKQIDELKRELKNTDDPKIATIIKQEIQYLERVRSGRSGASRPTTGTPKSGSI